MTRERAKSARQRTALPRTTDRPPVVSLSPLRAHPNDDAATKHFGLSLAKAFSRIRQMVSSGFIAERQVALQSATTLCLAGPNSSGLATTLCGAVHTSATYGVESSSTMHARVANLRRSTH